MTITTDRLLTNSMEGSGYDFDALAIGAAHLEDYTVFDADDQNTNQNSKDDTGKLFAVINGTSGNNNLTGTADDDTINGLGGNDTIQGLAGNDTLNGGSGTDFLEHFNFSATQGIIVDMLAGTVANDGFGFSDTISNFENLSTGYFTDIVTGNNNNNVIFGSSTGDTLNGAGGNDNISVDSAGFIDGGAGIDHLVVRSSGRWSADINGNANFQSRTDGIIVDLGAGTFTDNAYSFNGSLANMENVSGTNFNDILTGSSANNVLIGEGGNDTISGGDGNDTLLGVSGADTLIGGLGSDVHNGGDGFDTADYRGATEAVGFNVNSGGTIGEANGDTFSSIEQFYLSDFNDVVTGSSANETFHGEDGDDTITAGGGNDQIMGGTGTDYAIFSGVQASYTITDNMDGTHTIVDNVGTDGTDTLSTVEFATFADGNVQLIFVPTSGNDNLMGTAGNDVIDLLDGDDIYDGGDGNDQIMGGAGADDLDGGAGFDYTQYNNAAAGVVLSLASGSGSGGDAAGDTFANIEGAIGSNFNDTIGGSSIDNTLFGLGGNDRLFGLDGNDTLVGGAGDDQLWGGAGADQMLGGAGTDSVYYITATSRIVLSLAIGGTVGDAMGDSFGSIEQVFATNLNDIVVGSAGDETLYGLEGNDILSGAAGNDTLIGGDGNDTLYGGEGADDLQGGAGTDLASYVQSRAGVTVDLVTNVNSGGDAAGDTLTAIENLFGSRFGDNLTGNVRDNVINGLGGNDILDGAAGNDTLFAGAGSDIINGGAGNDTLSGQSGFNMLFGDAGNDLILGGSDQDFIDGGEGDDIMSGGMGTDRFIFDSDHGTDRINDFEDGTDLIDLTSLGISFADLTLMQTSQNVEIDTGEGIIVVNNAMVTDFDTTDFVF